MGITGLIPFLSKSSRRANIEEYAGQTVAIDAYCWLHKGAFSCADKLVMKEPTTMYVAYCLKMLNMLLSHNIKPILVFDGRYLPAKAETEKKRRECRLKNMKKGAELIRAGQVDEGRNYLRRSVDVTHEMALNLIKECRIRSIDCIVAPHEADAQLAYLSITNIAEVVITEDSDLLLFGCMRVLFKMDMNGNGLLIEKDKLHVSMGTRHDSFSMDKFRQMCILSGCDYLPSLPGIGLGKAKKFINHTNGENIYEDLLKLPVKLKMWSLSVTDEYREAFIEAEKTFKYQLVYDPIKRKQVPLNGGNSEGDFVGEKLEEDIAFQLAIGNLDPITLIQMDSYDPDSVQLRQNAKKDTSNSSIWSRNFTPRNTNTKKSTFPVHSFTKGITVTASLTPAVNRSLQSDKSPQKEMTKEFLLNLYANDTKNDESLKETPDSKNVEVSFRTTPDKSPVLFRKTNPFVMFSPSCSSVKKRRLNGLARLEAQYEPEELVESRYFKENQNIVSFSPEKKTSVLDIIDSQENPSRKIILDKFDDKREIIPQEEPTLAEEANSDMDTSTGEIQRNLSRFIFSADKSAKKEKEGDAMKCSSEESFSEISYKKIDRNESLKLSECVNQEKTHLQPLNNSEIRSDDIQTSPYFRRSSEEKPAAHEVLLNLRSPDRSVKNFQFMRSAKKNPKGMAQKSTTGKQQSLLTKFGFQPRPKLRSEKT